MLLPFTELTAGFAKRKGIDKGDEPGLLGHVEELGGRERSPGRVLPPHERLDADRVARGQVDHRLVVQAELTLIDGDPKIAFDFGAPA
jgi:hypothetical protein